jgi:voltage-gated potassium channel
VGLAAFLLGTLSGISPRQDRALTLICFAVALTFSVQYGLRLWLAREAAPARRSPSASSKVPDARHAPVERPRQWALGVSAFIDLLAAAPVPLALLAGASGPSARLYGVFWSLKLMRGNPALGLLARVLRNESRSLVSVTLAFAVVLLFASTAAYLAERTRQPQAFGSIPEALWFAIATLTTTGYGDKVPASLAGRILAGATMVSGIGLFALWAGILASGFAQELRRSEFLHSWDLVVRLPLFRNLGAAALSEIAGLLKVQRFGSGAAVVREGEPGDSMYFIAEGEVEVQAKSVRIRLGPGQFFGEIALVRSAERNATVVTLTQSRLLRLDVVDFRALAHRLPGLLEVVEAEANRRESELSRQA